MSPPPSRPPGPPPSAPPALQRACAWCGRWWAAAAGWHPPPPGPPAAGVRVTHGICPDCRSRQAADDTPAGPVG